MFPMRTREQIRRLANAELASRAMSALVLTLVAVLLAGLLMGVIHH